MPQDPGEEREAARTGPRTGPAHWGPPRPPTGPPHFRASFPRMLRWAHLLGWRVLSSCSTGDFVRSCEFPYLAGYAESLHDQVRPLVRSGELALRLQAKYPNPTSIVTDSLLRDHVLELKNQYLKRSSSLSKICFEDKLNSLSGVLGLHTYISRVQGSRTQAKNELRVSSLLKTMPDAFLHMVVVHELSHLKEKDHSKAFYQLCCHIEPNYHQLELDLRLYLTATDAAKRDPSASP
jgi:UTP pyrophosphatase